MKFNSQEEFIKYIDEHMHDPFIDPWEKDPNAPYGYIYKTTDLRNGKIYIGKHEADKFEYMDYVGSGIIVSAIKDKYGLEVLEVDLIAWYENLEELNKAEIYWIAYYNSNDSSVGYNKTEGGDGVIPTEETRAKMSASATGKVLSESTRKKMSESRKGRIVTEETRRKISESKKGYHHSEETKLKISEHNKLLYSNHPELHPFYGKSHSEETLLKMRKAKELNNNTGKIRITKNGEINYVNEDCLSDYLEEGWIVGTPEEFRDKLGKNHADVSGRNNPMYGVHLESKNKGKVWISKENEEKYILENELEAYLKLGWKKGLSKNRIYHLKCRYCGKEFTANHNSIKYCSDECKIMYKKGKD